MAKSKKGNVSLSGDDDLINIEDYMSDEPLLDDIDIEEEIDDEDEEEAEAEKPEVALQVEVNELKDRLMRTLAEAENQRKRAERDRRDAEIYGGRKLARDLLSVYDNLTRAIDAVDADKREENKGLIEGIEITQREMMSVFASHQITPINPEVGDKFNAELHQAMFEAPVPDVKAGCIIQVMAQGFMIADRLLRPAQVGLSSGK